MAENSYFGKLGKVTVDTLGYTKQTMELFKLEEKLSKIMRQHVKDCGTIIGQMENLLKEIKELEQTRLEQTKLLMEQDLKANENSEPKFEGSAD